MSSEKKSLGWLASALVITGIIAVTFLLVAIIYANEPTAEREAATKKTSMLVEVEQVQRGTFVPRIAGLGTVEAAQDVMLSPEIQGQVIEIDEEFIPGGFVNAGDVLVSIDPSDYENTHKQAQSAVRQAQADLNIELGRRDVAQKEFELLGQNLSAENKALVLREPQLEAAHAAVQSAKSALNQARIDLNRTKIKAPFEAQILSREVNLGSQVEPRMDLARLIGVEEYWAIVTVPIGQLERITFPRGDETGARVILKNRAWPSGVVREGRVVRLIGALDSQTRLARVLVSIKDPLALKDETQGPKMLVGSIVQAEIEGRSLEDVFRIDRDFLREGDRLWLKRDGILTITDAAVVFRDKDYAYITDGMSDGDLLVISNLATVAEGIELRTKEEAQE